MSEIYHEAIVTEASCKVGLSYPVRKVVFNCRGVIFGANERLDTSELRHASNQIVNKMVLDASGFGSNRKQTSRKLFVAKLL